VVRWHPDGRIEELCILPERHIPDGLKIAANGDLWITSVLSGGVDVVSASGAPLDFLETGGVPLNCVFHDGSLIITDLGPLEGIPTETAMTGRLWKVDVGVEGMPLFRGRIG
jgi:gluconolactonase